MVAVMFGADCYKSKPNHLEPVFNSQMCFKLNCCNISGCHSLVAVHNVSAKSLNILVGY